MGKSCDFFGKEDVIGKMVAKPLGPGGPITIHPVYTLSGVFIGYMQPWFIITMGLSLATPSYRDYELLCPWSFVCLRFFFMCYHRKPPLANLTYQEIMNRPIRFDGIEFFFFVAAKYSFGNNKLGIFFQPANEHKFFTRKRDKLGSRCAED